MIRQGFWSSPNHPEDPWARLLFMAMWNFADDYGVGSCNPRELLGFAFPNDRKITEDYLEALLKDVGTAYGVRYYTSGGRPYYCIPSWAAHQKVPHPSKSRNPGPDLADCSPDHGQHELSRDSHESGMTTTLGSPQIPATLSDKYKEKVKEKEKVKDPPPSSGGRRGVVSNQETSIGTRLAEDWRPPADVVDRLRARYPTALLDVILDEFINYWTALPGPRARKLDWSKTFTNWVHRCAAQSRYQVAPATGTQNAYGKLSALMVKYSEEEPRAELPSLGDKGDDEGQGTLAIG